jgi:hypothetical protein
MQNLLPSMFALGLAAIAALLLVRHRRSPSDCAVERDNVSRALALATIFQAIHFAEEISTGFHERLGPLFGLPGIPISGFITFNLACLVMWVLSIPGLRSSRSGAFFAAWFLAIAGLMNGLLHPILAIAHGGYFPGLVSSLFIGAAGLWLWFRLQKATEWK